MTTTAPITVGMPVYGADAHLIGPIERHDDESLHVGGHHVPRAAIARTTTTAVYLKIAGQALLARHDKQTEQPADQPAGLA